MFKPVYTGNSLSAGSCKKYTRGQASIAGTNIKFQFKGDDGNRGYGLTFELPASITLRNWMKKQTLCLGSLAGTSRLYLPVQVIVEGNKLHFQFKGSEGNRSYGYSSSTIANQATMDFFVNRCTVIAKEWYN